MSRFDRFAFPASSRLKKRPDFLAVQQEGRRFRTVNFIILTRTSGTSSSRLGITVSRKIGNAVVRNRVKRLIREFWRQNIDKLPIGCDVLIIARRGAGGLGLAEVTEELDILFALSQDQ